MAYEPKVWKCDDTITADELNRMEEGISSAQGGGGSAPYLIFKKVSTEETTEPCPSDASKNIYITTVTYNHSWQEVHDALNADTPVFLVTEDMNWYLVISAGHNLLEDSYEIDSGYGTIGGLDSPTTKVVVSRNSTECSGHH